jgi:hypothetical protein
MSDSKTSKEFINLFESLDDERKASLFDYAEFLLSKGGPVKKEILEPLDIPRPETETVVGAIKRLKETYPMIESMAVFSSASSLMTEHMVNGRDVIEVIDEMEELFQKYHAELQKDGE